MRKPESLLSQHEGTLLEGRHLAMQGQKPEATEYNAGMYPDDQGR